MTVKGPPARSRIRTRLLFALVLALIETEAPALVLPPVAEKVLSATFEGVKSNPFHGRES